ncbi:MAG: glycosyltransferase family 4 protein [Candidatus Accumulibacter sp.]|uniref:glycosyltransferase family 4 protein n=1 Tax=Accumulibacter sp. TaxID=2053492 RepID=UPI001AC7A5FA|nr:glycosyltransferase family 1 protein [Accumulibacter sp.]MBN8438406.1 glycosyltransferase family 4 protein [Accumulibacter sp.]
MIKVVALLEQDPESGGGFYQGLNAILQMAELGRDKFEFAVLTTNQKNLARMSRFGIAASFTPLHWFDRWLVQNVSSAFWRSLRKRTRWIGPLEKTLLAMRCDLAYFVSPSPLPAALQTLNYITTVWDLCHREHPEFPEVRCFGELLSRENMHRTVLPAAFRIISDSKALADKLVRYYGIDRERIVAMPFGPSPILAGAGSDVAADVLRRFNLEAGYFFYPAHLWAHKNHIRILEAIALLHRQGTYIRVVFAGGDKGERKHLEASATQLGIASQTRFLGFVPDNTLAGLYAGCRAVVMPTYFGPTNLPPLEAWANGRPLVYSRHLTEQAGDAALLVDPDDAKSLADAMQQLLDDTVAKRLVARGRERLAIISAQRSVAASDLSEALQLFALRRSCWATIL